MRTPTILLSCAAVLTCGRPELAETPPALNCRVERISDGDSFYCNGGKRVRLIGIDAPEMDQGELGRASREGLTRLMPLGSEVRLETDVRAADQFRRTLAYAWSGTVMINREMIRQGWAMLYTVPPNVRYVERLQTAQDSARREGAGHWGTGGFECQPSARRRGKC
jgi:micrococcal nuclease